MNGWLVAVGLAGAVGWLVFGYVQHPPRRRAAGLGTARWPVYAGEYLCALAALYGLLQTVLDSGQL